MILEQFEVFKANAVSYEDYINGNKSNKKDYVENFITCGKYIKRMNIKLNLAGGSITDVYYDIYIEFNDGYEYIKKTDIYKIDVSEKQYTTNPIFAELREVYPTVLPYFHPAYEKLSKLALDINFEHVSRKVAKLIDEAANPYILSNKLESELPLKDEIKQKKVKI